MIGPWLGRQFSNYQLIGRLGAGGMGEVYRARDLRLNRDVAIKVLAQAADGDEQAARRLMREARAAAALDHPNICTVYEVGEVDGHPYIAMQLVQGESLAARLARGSLALDEAVALGRQIVAALAEAHRRGVVHRDVKPQNIMITPDGLVKVLDFGLAETSALDVDLATETALTFRGGVAGTVPYMSPEQARGEPLDARTDLFSCGIVLYEMLAGTQPFAGATTAVIFDAILNRDPPPLRGLLPDIPEALEQAIAGALVKDRSRRVQTAAQLHEQLSSGATREAVAVQTRTPAEAPARRRTARPSRRRLLASTFAAIAVVGAVAALWWRPGGSLPPIRSLAVVPMPASGSAPLSEALQGFAAAIGDELSRIPSIEVAPASAVAPYATSSTRAADVARGLGSDGVLWCVISQQQSEVQVVATLMHGVDERTLWSGTYRRESSELHGLERDLARDLATRLGLPWSDTAGRAERPGKSAAYDLYLRGRYHIVRWSEASIDQAIALLERSTAEDPDFAPSQAMLGVAYSVKSFNYKPNDPQWREKGYAAVEKALALDERSADAHFARGMLLWQPSEGFPHFSTLTEYRRSIRLKPGFDEAWVAHGIVLFHIGHLEEATESLQKGIALNPANTQARFRLAPVANYNLRYDMALDVLKQVPREAYPSQWTYHYAWALIALGRLQEASEAIDSAMAGGAVDQGGVIHAVRALLRARRGDPKGAIDDVNAAIALGSGFGHFHHTATSIGEVYSLLGDYDRALQWIERASYDGFPCFTFFERNPHLAGARTSAPFQAFLKRLRTQWETLPPEAR